jgi:quinoprotein glucose dehydrogenase
MGLGKLGRREDVPAIFAMLSENADRDPLLRHAGVMALVKIGDIGVLVGAETNTSDAVHMGAVLALRRLRRSEVALFLRDSDPLVVLEAARAINDQPINGAMLDLAALIQNPGIVQIATTNSEALLRRVLNANFRCGTPQTAKALASFAARQDVPENMRAEALEELADWPHPSGRDRVVGLWRPVAATRHRETAAEALQPGLGELLRGAPDGVRVAGIRAANRLSITNAVAILHGLVADTKLSPEVRTEALKALPELDPENFDDALKVAQADSSEELRKEATLLQALAKSPNAAATLAARLDTGTLGEKQGALTALGALSGATADEVLARWLDDLQAGKVPEELQLDLVEAAAKRSAVSVRQKLTNYESSRPKDDPLAYYHVALRGGNAAQGKKIFFGRADVQCVRCHKINGQGGDVGPDLSHVGGQKDRPYLLESIVEPNKKIAQGFESVLVLLKNGESYAGVLKSENDIELVINSPDAGVVTVKKADIQSRQRALSPMPDGLAQMLSRQDLRNLIEFLSGLK